MKYGLPYQEPGSGVVENRVLKRISGPKREKVSGENCMMRTFIISTLHHTFLGW
jgi:hypothetical protein